MTATHATPSAVLAQVDTDLRAIWSDPTPERASIPPKSRVCTMNLVVVGASVDVVDRYTRVVDSVTSSIPARAILVALEPNAPGGELRGEVTAVRSAEGGENVFSERVRLVATGNVCARVGSAVEALLVPEIPTALVWLGRVHVDDPVFEAIAEQSQRVITDSEYTTLASVLHLGRWAREDIARPHIADLAWVRLGPWQELVARLFDDARFFGHAQRISRVTLKQASEKGARLGSEGALLLGWIATRLHWKMQRIGGALRFKRPDGGNVAVEFGIVPKPEGVPLSTLGSIVVDAEAEGVTLRGSIERDLASGIEAGARDADVVSWKREISGSPAIEQRVRLGANKGAKWLERTLHRPAHDPALIESLAFADELTEDGITCG